MVLVHCSSGVSRSGTVVLYFVMKHRAVSLAEAWRIVSAARRVLLPNDLFFKARLWCFLACVCCLVAECTVRAGEC